MWGLKDLNSYSVLKKTLFRTSFDTFSESKDSLGSLPPFWESKFDKHFSVSKQTFSTSSEAKIKRPQFLRHIRPKVEFDANFLVSTKATRHVLHVFCAEPYKQHSLKCKLQLTPWIGTNLQRMVTDQDDLKDHWSFLEPHGQTFLMTEHPMKKN